MILNDRLRREVFKIYISKKNKYGFDDFLNYIFRHGLTEQVLEGNHSTDLIAQINNLIKTIKDSKDNSNRATCEFAETYTPLNPPYQEAFNITGRQIKIPNQGVKKLEPILIEIRNIYAHIQRVEVEELTAQEIDDGVNPNYYDEIKIGVAIKISKEEGGQEDGEIKVSLEFGERVTDTEGNPAIKLTHKEKDVFIPFMRERERIVLDNLINFDQ